MDYLKDKITASTQNLLDYQIPSSTESTPDMHKLQQRRNSQMQLLMDSNSDLGDHQEASRDAAFDGVRPRKKAITIENIPLDYETDKFNESYIVIEFDRKTDRNTLHWVIDKIRSKKSNFGAELLLRKEPSVAGRGLTLHISATKEKFLELADEMGIVKQTRNGNMRNFNIACLDDFFVDESMNANDLLTPADRQIIIKYALDSIRAIENERYIPGTKNITLYHGESIIQACIKGEVIKNMYSLHDKEILKKLSHDWYFSIRKQPLDTIRDYFGESIGIYFAFIGFYTIALVIPSILGFLQLAIQIESVSFFSVFYVIWITIFLEIWKRKCSELAYKWGTISMTNLDTPRIGYYGKIGRDPVTGKMTPQYPIWRTYFQMYLISLPFIILSIFAATILALSQFWIEDELKLIFGEDSYIIFLPSIVQSILVAVLSGQYEKFANWLTDMENHRTQQQYERHRVNKLIILEFVNNFLSLFYIAFVLRDIKMLKSQLTTQFIIIQAAQNLQETLLPIFRQKFFVFTDKLFNNNENYKKLDNLDDDDNVFNIIELAEDDPRIEQNKQESILDEYNSTYEDYLELYIQFGYVVLFSSVAPIAAFWALINNLLEVRLDGFKLCNIFKRPFAKRARDTGAWLMAFQALAIISVMSNCCILYLSPQIRNLGPELTPTDWLVIFVVIEHCLLTLTWWIHKIIPDSPMWVRIMLAKADYESRQALKRENAQRTRYVLFRRFRSVHGPHAHNFQL